MDYSQGLKAPRVIIVFFVKAAILFVIWKMLYILLFRPHGILDAPLTTAVGGSTAGVLNLFAEGSKFKSVRSFPVAGPEEDAEPGGVVDIYRNGENTLRIAAACNGLEIMILYAGFLFCFPSSGPARRGIYLVIGLAAIFLLNVIRCSLLVWIFLRYRKYLDFSHHFLFTFIVYSCVFFLWYKYASRRSPAPARG